MLTGKLVLLTRKNRNKIGFPFKTNKTGFPFKTDKTNKTGYMNINVDAQTGFINSEKQDLSSEWFLWC